MIPSDFLVRVIEDTDLVSLVGESVDLKKAGSEFTACCPFHNEKTPSFTVSPRKQFYHCFGCGAHGNAIDWAIDFLRMDFRAAVEQLAKRLGRELPSEPETPKQVEQRNKRSSIADVLKRADVIYRSKLRESAEAIEYLRDVRGITGKTAAEYLIGWAPDDKGTLRNSGMDVPLMIDAGLLGESESGWRYDRFRGRIMFPVRDVSGRIVGFGGRTITDDKKRPKYLNSPETDLFKKGKLLYGLHEVITDRERTSPVLVVEGYMDVVQLAEHGISAVATLGTAVTPDQVQLLFRRADAVLFVFDGDKAGQDAAWRAAEAVLPLMDGTRSVSFVSLPDGKDPDDLAREMGADTLNWLSANAMPLSDFIIKRLPDKEGADKDSPEGKARLAKAAAELIAAVPAGPYLDLLSEAVRSAWKLKVRTLRDAVRGLEQKNAYTPGWRSAWEEGFARSKEGNIKASLHNVILILENHPLWQGMFAMNSFANQIVMMRAAPWSGGRTGQLEESDGTEVAAWIGDPVNYGLTVGSAMVLEAIEAVAKRRKFHPVLQYLDSLEWDGEKRLEHLMADFFGADFNDYTAACGKNMMISAVARVRAPGCKVDEMLILEGPQGAGKSSAVRALCGPEWFAEMLESPQSKDFYQTLTGRWVIEIPEMQAFNKADRNRIKAAVSAQEDTYRPSYGRYARQFPRQSIFIGTTNDESYLKDETGARRFMPVNCREVDVRGLHAMRDQLWAEANARMLAGEPWHKFPAEAAEEQDKRFDVDAWEDPILDWLSGKYPAEKYQHIDRTVTQDRPIKRASVSEIMRHALGIEMGKHAKPDQIRVGSIMRHLGWRRKQERGDYGERRWYYERPCE